MRWFLSDGSQCGHTGYASCVTWIVIVLVQHLSCREEDSDHHTSDGGLPGRSVPVERSRTNRSMSSSTSHSSRPLRTFSYA